jgi:hypothetical protein
MRNSEILSAILNKWAQPLVGAFVQGNMAGMPWVQAVQNKIKATGWVSPGWNLWSELAPIMEGISGNILTPILNQYISRVDDASLPKMAHEIVDAALKKGELRLLEGKVVFEREDLQRLKRMLELNMPWSGEEVEIKVE